MAFIRICSGKFERGMKAHHVRLNKEIRLAYSSQLMAQERETVDVGYAGDIVGINDKGTFQIGDSLTQKKNIKFSGIPRFSPEFFGRLVVTDALKRKQLDKGIKQLVDEGSIQLFYRPSVGWQDPILAVVGMLQFEVLLFRLEDEYGVKAKLEQLPFKLARWPMTKEGEKVTTLEGGLDLYHDAHDNPVVLLKGDWELSFIEEKNSDLEFMFTSQD